MIWEDPKNMTGLVMKSKGFESIGRLQVPKRLFASDGSEVLMCSNGSISRKSTLRLLTGIFGKLIALALLWMTLWAMWALSDARANMVNPTEAVNAIIGESEAEPFIGKIAIGEAIRNKGNLRGVYGLSSTRITKASSRVRAECEAAWRESRASSLVGDASVWGTDSDVRKFKKSRWFRSYEFVRRIGNHSFFRLKKRGAK